MPVLVKKEAALGKKGVEGGGRKTCFNKEGRGHTFPQAAIKRDRSEGIRSYSRQRKSQLLEKKALNPTN